MDSKLQDFWEILLYLKQNIGHFEAASFSSGHKLPVGMCTTKPDKVCVSVCQKHRTKAWNIISQCVTVMCLHTQKLMKIKN